MTKHPIGEPSLPDKVLIIDEALTEAKIPHAIGGALALAYYAEPRATIDVDVNLFIPAEKWRKVVDILVPLGVSAEELEESALLRDGQCRLWWGENPVDLFFANAPIHDAMRDAIRRVPFAGATIPILGPEHLAVCKAMFDRPKDWLDLEQMLLGTAGLDVSEIERWLIQMVGHDDPRLRHLRTLQPPV
ncbi:MAG TPA: hypothetical protein VFX45_09480 [Solirubrobacterales bacterium]|nr:hypothetical protein [Solirubrobacterales bacterium]